MPAAAPLPAAEKNAGPRPGQRGMLSSEASWSPDAREESKDEDVVTNMSLGGICDQVMKPTEEARQDLSTDMLLILFKTMSIHDLAVVLLVSRSWRHAALDPELPAWSTLNADTFRGVFHGPEQPLAETRLLREPVQPALGQKRGQAQWKPPSLLAGQHGALMDPEAVQRAVTRCPLLVSLDVSSLARVDDVLLQVISSKCSRLQCLRLRDACSLPAAVSTSGITHLVAKCSHLANLDLSCTAVSDRGVAALAMLTNLTNLRLYRCTRVTGSMLPPVLASCRQLRHLNLAACPVTPANVARFAKGIGTRPIRVNLLSDKDLPPAVDVWCGICKTVLFAGLASYVVVPYLPHRFQLLTHARPHEHAAVALSAQEPYRLACACRCHMGSWLLLQKGAVSVVDPLIPLPSARRRRHVGGSEPQGGVTWAPSGREWGADRTLGFRFLVRCGRPPLGQGHPLAMMTASIGT